MSLFSFIAAVLLTVQFPDTFLGSVPVGNNPVDLCISPDGQRAYAAVEWGYATAVNINGYSDFSLAGLVNIDGEPVAVQCSENGEVLYVADGENSEILVVNTETLEITDSFSVQPDPVDMVLSAQNKRIFLSHSGGMVTVISTEDSSVEGVFWAGNALNSLSISPCGDFVYAPDAESPLETVINASTLGVTRFSSGMDSRASAVSSSGETLYLSSTEWNLICVINTEGLAPETTFVCPGDAPSVMAALPALPYLYGINTSAGNLSVYGIPDFQLLGTLDVPGSPVNLAVHPDGERIFLVCASDNRMKVYGFDPAGTGVTGLNPTLNPSSSPSSAPSVMLSGVSGRVILRVFDLAGRSLFENEVEVTDGLSTEFFLPDVPGGLLFVTAESVQGRFCTEIIVLEP